MKKKIASFFLDVVGWTCVCTLVLFTISVEANLVAGGKQEGPGGSFRNFHLGNSFFGNTTNNSGTHLYRTKFKFITEFVRYDYNKIVQHYTKLGLGSVHG